jgi:hypothetical protein
MAPAKEIIVVPKAMPTTVSLFLKSSTKPQHVRVEMPASESPIKVHLFFYFC